MLHRVQVSREGFWPFCACGFFDMLIFFVAFYRVSLSLSLSFLFFFFYMMFSEFATLLVSAGMGRKCWG